MAEVAPLRLIYCAEQAKRDTRRLRYRCRGGTKDWRERQRARAGQCYAQEIRPGIWMCLCCEKRVRVVT